MGQFSWMYADTDNKINLLEGESAWLLQPNGKHIYESEYDGYGNFGGYDAYDLVLEWNREFLNVSMLPKPDRTSWSNDMEGTLWYQKAMNAYEKTVSVLEKYMSGASDIEMQDFSKQVGYGFTNGEDWKRNLGISIACSDEQNAALPFPIKICKEPCDYDSVCESKNDPNQGWYRDNEVEDELDYYDDYER